MPAEKEDGGRVPLHSHLPLLSSGLPSPITCEKDLRSILHRIPLQYFMPSHHACTAGHNSVDCALHRLLMEAAIYATCAFCPFP